MVVQSLKALKKSYTEFFFEKALTPNESPMYKSIIKGIAVT